MGPEGPVTTCRGFRPVFSRDPSEWSRLPLRVHPANAGPWALVPASQPPRLCLRPTGNSQPRAYRGVLVPETLTHCDDSARTGWASLPPTPRPPAAAAAVSPGLSVLPITAPAGLCGAAPPRASAAALEPTQDGLAGVDIGTGVTETDFSMRGRDGC